MVIIRWKITPKLLTKLSLLGHSEVILLVIIKLETIDYINISRKFSFSTKFYENNYHDLEVSYDVFK